MSNKDNAPERIWIIKSLDHRYRYQVSIYETYGDEYVLKSTADKQAKQKEDWFDAIIKSAYKEILKLADEVHKERIEEILKPVRDVMEIYKGRSKESYLEYSEHWKAIKKTLELADKEVGK